MKNKMPRRIQAYSMLNSATCSFGELMDMFGYEKLLFKPRRIYDSTIKSFCWEITTAKVKHDERTGEETVELLHRQVPKREMIDYTSAICTKENLKTRWSPHGMQKNTYTATLLFHEEDETWSAELTLQTTCVLLRVGGDVLVIDDWQLSDWKKANRFPAEPISVPWSHSKTVEMIYNEIGPQAAAFWNETRMPAIAFISPQLEILEKAGYKFCETLLDNPDSVSKPEADCFNRLTKPGKNPKEIFKTDKSVYKTLINERYLEVWDSFRKMNKIDKLSRETVQDFYARGYSEKNIESIRKILAQRYKDKPVFTYYSLIRYLDRVDMYEAIETEEACMLILDYLRLCRTLGNVKPVLDGDSLKREHDVTARTVRNKRNEEQAKVLNASCGYLKKFNYEESIFLIRGVESYDDLIDEAKQQHNCVAAYAPLIAKRTSMIYFMREKCNPSKSFVTVELLGSKGARKLGQVSTAHNGTLRNKAGREFLSRWIKYVNAVEVR